MTVKIVVAYSDNRAIGKDNALLWHLPEDMKHFRELTSGHTVIMGRKTWESLPEKFRPLPNRKNIVVSRNPDYAAPGADVCLSLDEALAVANHNAFVIGGAQLYNEAINLASEIYVTQVHRTYPDADTFFPGLNMAEWELYVKECNALSVSGLKYSMIKFQRMT